MNTTLYTIIKNRILAGGYDKTSMKIKLGAFLTYDQITAEEYGELMLLIEPQE